MTKKRSQQETPPVPKKKQKTSLPPTPQCRTDFLAETPSGGSGSTNSSNWGPPSSCSSTTSSVNSPAVTKNIFTDWEVDSRYQLQKLLGRGSYGHVAQALDTTTQKKVAIKRVANVFDHELDCKRIYREIHILRKLRHTQVILLVDIIQPADYNKFNDLYLVFEYVDTDLNKLILSPQFLSVPHIQVFLYQLLCGLRYIHSSDVIHRDMKPANILLNEDCSLKICDFGLSRVVDGQYVHDEQNGVANSNKSDSTLAPKISRSLTKHVVTRWYRAPELILLQNYGKEVDVWSLGCIFGELLSMQKESFPDNQNRKPLFPGRSCFPLSADKPTTYSDKLDQLNVIFKIIGTPHESDIGNLGEVKQYLRNLPPQSPMNLQEVYVGAPPEALDLLSKMLQFNPENRMTVDEALAHPFLAKVRRPKLEVVEKVSFAMDFENIALTKKALKAKIYEEILELKEQLSKAEF